MDVGFDADRCLIAGMTGTGKTTCALRWMAKHPAKKVLIYDHRLEMAKRLGVAPVETRADLADAVDGPDRYVVYQSTLDFGRDKESAHAWWWEFIYEWSMEDEETEKLVFEDEVQKFEDSRRMLKAKADCINDLRKQRLHTLFIGQQMNRLNDTTCNQNTELYVFAHRSALAATKLQDYGVTFEQAKLLKRLDFIYVDSANLKEPVPGRIEL